MNKKQIAVLWTGLTILIAGGVCYYRIIGKINFQLELNQLREKCTTEEIKKGNLPNNMEAFEYFSELRAETAHFLEKKREYIFYGKVTSGILISLIGMGLFLAKGKK